MPRVIATAVALLSGAACLCAAPTFVNAEPWRGSHRFGIGLRSTDLSLESSQNPCCAMALRGSGGHLRVGVGHRWELELTGEQTSGDAAGGALTRTAHATTVSALVRVRPDQPWDWYLLWGIGGTRDHVRYTRADGSAGEQSFQHTHVHLGIGFELRCNHLALGAEARAVGMARDDTALDGPTYRGVDGPVPYEASGGQLSLTATWYF